MDFKKHFAGDKFSADYSIEEWNSLIQGLFASYFRSSSEINENRAMLRVEVVNFIRLKATPDYFNLFQTIHSLYRKAIAGDYEAALFELNELLAEVGNTDFRWMGYVNSQIDPSQLDTRDKIAYYFEKIDQILEGVYRPRLVHLSRFASYIATGAFAPAQKTSFGQLVDNFPRVAFPELELLLFDPHVGIKVSQWRNIASHKSYTIGPDTVFVTYGKSFQHTKEITHGQVKEILDSILSAYAALRLSQVLIYLDYIPEIEKAFALKIDEMIRFDSNMFVIIHNLQLVGFNFSDYREDKNTVILDLYKHHHEDLKTSIIHSSQCLERVAHAIELDPLKKGKFTVIGIRICSNVDGGVLAEARVRVSDAMKKVREEIDTTTYIDCMEFRFARKKSE